MHPAVFFARSLLVVILGVFGGFCLAWGDSGHEIIARLAFSVLTPQVKVAVCQAIPAKMHCDLGRAATWADRIKNRKQYAWSGQLHFVNPEDKPPAVCVSNFQAFLSSHDNIIWALDKFWRDLTSSSSGKCTLKSNKKRMQEQSAILFLIHLMGDLHNPLHLTGETRGGNDTECIFDRKKHNLHVLWDSEMLNKRIKTDFSGSLVQFIGYLQSKPKYLQLKFLSLWKRRPSDGYRLFCNLSKKAASEEEKPSNISPSLHCIHQWAVSLNKLNCKGIWKFSHNEDLAGWYYLNNVELVENLLIVGAMRLAFVLNEIFQVKE